MDQNTQILIGLIVYGIIMFGLGFYYRPRFDTLNARIRKRLSDLFGTKIVRGKPTTKAKPKATAEQLKIVKVGEYGPIDGHTFDVIVKPPIDDYVRELFDHSINQRTNGNWSAREQVLQRDSLVPVTLANGKIVAGQWQCPYTGQTFTSPTQIEIDHIVPLAESWICGAKYWTNKQRSEFSRDLDNLIAVSGTANQQKGRKGPDEWMPAVTTSRVWYLQRWVYSKQKYNLGMSEAEILAMAKYSQ